MSGKALEGWAAVSWCRRKLLILLHPSGHQGVIVFVFISFCHKEDNLTMAHIFQRLPVADVFSIFLTMCRISPPAGRPDWARHSETRICNSPLFCCGSAQAGRGFADLAGAVCLLCLTPLHKDIGDRHSIVRHQGRSS